MLFGKSSFPSRHIFTFFLVQRLDPLRMTPPAVRNQSFLASLNGPTGQAPRSRSCPVLRKCDRAYGCQSLRFVVNWLDPGAVLPPLFRHATEVAGGLFGGGLLFDQSWGSPRRCFSRRRDRDRFLNFNGLTYGILRSLEGAQKGERQPQRRDWKWVR